MDNTRLGQALVRNGKLSQEKLKYALAMHDKIGGDFAPLLVKLGYITDEDLTATIAKLEGIPTIDVSSLIIPVKLVKSIPKEVIEKHNVIPVSRKDNVITLAMADVGDFEAIEEIQFLTGCRIEPILASREGIRRSIIQFFYGDESDPLEASGNDLDSILENNENIEVLKALIKALIEKNVISKQDIKKFLD